jgi:hypothetical protein
VAVALTLRGPVLRVGTGPWRLPLRLCGSGLCNERVDLLAWLRRLSPPVAAAEVARVGLPEVDAAPPWSRRCAGRHRSVRPVVGAGRRRWRVAVSDSDRDNDRFRRRESSDDR